MAAEVTTRLTAEQFAARFADVPFCELERGEVIHLTAGGWRHSRICFKVAMLLGEWAERTGAGRVLTNEAGLITSRDPDSVRGVDVMFFSYDRVPRGHEPDSFVEIPANLAVEVLGKGQGWKKMTEKVGEYIRLGVDRAWIIDPRHETLHVFSPNDPPRVFEKDADVRDDLVLPGFSCRVGEFFVD
jgi:Uma2 family endonuclease